jgi:hypothetical protein
LKVIQQLTTHPTRVEFLDAATRGAEAFTMPESGRWIWDSLAAGRALEAPFHAVMPAETILRVLRGQAA